MKLTRSFYTRPTLDVAKELLGKYLVFNSIAGKIIEVEAYIGQNDKACHGSHGKTKRNEIMFGPGGFSYIYFVYGMHHMFNIVTEKEGFPAAVLIRAIDIPNCDGPGKLTRSMGISLKENGLDLTGSKLYIEDRQIIPSKIIKTTRVGIDYAGQDAKKLWRFIIKK